MLASFRSLHAPLFLCLTSAALSQDLTVTPAPPPAAAPNQASAAHLALSRLPMAFEPNQGQAPDTTRYLVRAGAVRADFREQSIALTLPEPGGAQDTMEIRFPGAGLNPQIAGEGEQQGHVNYLLGPDPSSWHRNLPTYQRIRYKEIYPGTDLLFYGNGSKLEHDFVVSPAADPSQIVFTIGGAKQTAIQADGSLAVTLSSGTVRFEKPRAYQKDGNTEHDVSVSFLAKSDGAIGFRVGAYNPAQPLVIDPVLTFETYLAGTTGSTTFGVATDSSGNTYVTGMAWSGYPVTADAFQTTCPACPNNPTVFVTKLNPAGTAQVYSTFLGGSLYNRPTAIAVDANGNAIVTGYTWSSDFPTKKPVEQPLNTNANYGFISSLTPDGSGLNYSSLLGGSATYAYALALDSSGDAYITGVTSPESFPVTAGALDIGASGNLPDNILGFISKFTPAGSLAYSALIGDFNGSGSLVGPQSIAVDTVGAAYITGLAASDYPTTAGSYIPTLPYGVYQGAVVSKLHPDGSKFDYSTFLAGGTTSSIALDPAGNAWIAGLGTVGAFPYATGTNFLAKLTSDGSALAQSSTFSSSISKVSLDANQNVWLSGATSDTSFPLVNPVVGIIAGNTAGNGSRGQSTTSYLTEFDPAIKSIKFSTFLGNSSGSAYFALDPEGTIHVAGDTFAPMYTSPGAFLSTWSTPAAGDENIQPFTAVINPAPPSATLCSSDAPPLMWVGQIVNTSGILNLPLRNCGTADLTIQAVTSDSPAFTVTGMNACLAAMPPGASCAMQVLFSPTQLSEYAGNLMVSSNAAAANTYLSMLGTVVGALSPTVSLSTSNLDFGSAQQGATSPTQTITLTNLGQQDLIVVSAVTASGDFAQTNNCGTLPVSGGTCTITVSFTPTAGGSRSGTLTIADNALNSPQTVALHGFGVAALSIGPAQGGSISATVASGSTAAYSLLLSAASGISGSVSLACTGAPQNAACSVSPTTLSLQSGSAVPFAVTVTTTAQSAALAPNSSLTLAGIGLCGLLTVPLIAKRRRRILLFPVLVSLACAASLFSGCGGGGGGGNGGGGSTTGTPAGTYSLTLTASIGTTKDSQPLTLVVQ